jgi:hypothetical protein
MELTQAEAACLRDADDLWLKMLDMPDVAWRSTPEDAFVDHLLKILDKVPISRY